MVKGWKKPASSALKALGKSSKTSLDGKGSKGGKGSKSGKNGKSSGKGGKSGDKSKSKSDYSSSGSDYSDGSYSDYSDSDYSSDYSGSDYSSGSGSKNKSGDKNKTSANGTSGTKAAANGAGASGGDSSSDDSSSYGCGVYHRRESLTPESSVRSFSSRSSRSSKSSYDSRSYSSDSRSRSRSRSSSKSPKAKGNLSRRNTNNTKDTSKSNTSSKPSSRFSSDGSESGGSDSGSISIDSIQSDESSRSSGSSDSGFQKKGKKKKKGIASKAFKKKGGKKEKEKDKNKEGKKTKDNSDHLKTKRKSLGSMMNSKLNSSRNVLFGKKSTGNSNLASNSSDTSSVSGSVASTKSGMSLKSLRSAPAATGRPSRSGFGGFGIGKGSAGRGGAGGRGRQGLRASQSEKTLSMAAASLQEERAALMKRTRSMNQVKKGGSVGSGRSGMSSAKGSKSSGKSSRSSVSSSSSGSYSSRSYDSSSGSESDSESDDQGARRKGVKDSSSKNGSTVPAASTSPKTSKGSDTAAQDVDNRFSNVLQQAREQQKHNNKATGKLKDNNRDAENKSDESDDEGGSEKKEVKNSKIDRIGSPKNTLASAYNQLRNHKDDDDSSPTDPSKDSNSRPSLFNQRRSTNQSAQSTTSNDTDEINLTTSYRVLQIENANSNLHSISDIDLMGEWSNVKSEKNSSRFASMMKKLRSSGDVAADHGHGAHVTHQECLGEESSDSDEEKAATVSNARASTSSTVDTNTFNHDEALFHTPKIVDEHGDSIRFDDPLMRESRRSSAGDDADADSIVLDESSSKSSKGSLSTESSVEAGSEEHLNRSDTNPIRTQSSEDEDDDSSEYLSSEDDDDYGPDMTILTPITEVENESQTAVTYRKSQNRSSLMSIRTEASADEDSMDRFFKTYSNAGNDDGDKGGIHSVREVALGGVGVTGGSGLEDERNQVKELDFTSKRHSTASDVTNEVQSSDEDEEQSERISSGQENEDSDSASIDDVDSHSNSCHTDQRDNNDNQKVRAAVAISTEQEINALPSIVKRAQQNDPSLRQICFDSCGLNDSDVSDLFKSLHDNTYATHISLAHNHLGDKSATSLGKVLFGNESITHLNLRGNQIGKKGAMSLKKVLRVNETLVEVDLNDNEGLDLEVMEDLFKSSSVFVSLDQLPAGEPSGDSTRNESGVGSRGESSNGHVSQGQRGDFTQYNVPYSSSKHDAAIRREKTDQKHSEDDSESDSEYLSSPSRELSSSAGGAGLSEVDALRSGQNSQSSSPNKTLSTTRSNIQTSEKQIISGVTTNGISNSQGKNELSGHKDLEHKKIFHDAFTAALESQDRTPNEEALLLAMSLALSNLDSEWALNTASAEDLLHGGEDINYLTLGDRERICPWRKQMEDGLDEMVETDDFSNDNDEVRDSENMKRRSSSFSCNKSPKYRRDSDRVASLTTNSEVSHYLASEDEDEDFTDPIPRLKLQRSSSSNMETPQKWVSSFRKLDPRWQIRKFFNDMSVFSSVQHNVNAEEESAIFSVWRPTSADAIAKMMKGEGTGKGLEIKGKSAKCGALSGYIPFLQIHEDKHKSQIRSIPKTDRTKIFFKTEHARDEVGEYLGKIAKEMTLRVAKAKFILAKSKFGTDAQQKLKEEVVYAANTMDYEIEDPKVIPIDDYAPTLYCLDVPCRALWEGLVVRKDITRNSNSEFETGRGSQPAFQDMNFAALRRRKPGEPVPVLYQFSDNPMDSRMLVMAYEEEGRVVPVVSDFDCFLIGSRNFSYEDKMPQDQVQLLDWCVSQIEYILENQTGPSSWTSCWLEILKEAARKGFYPTMPRFGFGDPTSYSMIEAAVHRSAKTCGAVRHGPECFNFFFPQDLDEQLLIIFPGGQLWKYVTVKELQGILHQKIREGYTFPLNPKWVLCDQGWSSIFQELLDSPFPSVKRSIDLWFPPESGLRERILDISHSYPEGFISCDETRVSSSLAEQEYERYLVLQRAKHKVKAWLYWKNMLEDIREQKDTDKREHLMKSVIDMKFLGDREIKKLSSARNIEEKTLRKIKTLQFYCKSKNVEGL